MLSMKARENLKNWYKDQATVTKIQEKLFEMRIYEHLDHLEFTGRVNQVGRNYFAAFEVYTHDNQDDHIYNLTFACTLTGKFK